jgi:hypothetical protein
VQNERRLSSLKQQKRKTCDERTEINQKLSNIKQNSTSTNNEGVLDNKNKTQMAT